MKRLLSILTVIALMLCLCLPALADAPADFTDVPEGEWYRADVLAARDLGLMEGIGGGLFDPTRSLNKAEAVALAARARSLYLKDGEAFARHDEWYRVYVEYALENGFLKEEPEDWTADADRDFCAALFAAAMPAEALEPVNEVEDGAIPDVPADDEAVYVLYRAGIMVGDENHRFNPDKPILRCEIAAVVNRLMKSESRLPVEMKKPAPDAEITDPPVAPVTPE